MPRLNRHPQALHRFDLSKTLINGLIAGLSALAFVVFRNRFASRDGLTILRYLARDVSMRGAFLTHDSLLESYIQARFWVFGNQLFEWDVRQSYRAMYALAGGLFVFVLLWSPVAARIPKWGLFLLLFLSGVTH